jgi:hypothetical protein
MFHSNSPADDNAIASGNVSDSELAFLHGAFEKAFCSKLQRSGSSNFANVSDCSFRFIYAPVSFADTIVAQQ